MQTSWEIGKNLGRAIAFAGLLVAACASAPAPTPVARSSPATASTTDGPYRLELVLPHVDWRSSDQISGTAILSETEPGHGSISGSSRLIGFSYVEVGGERKVQPIWTADCAQHQLEPATPLTQPLGKSGAIENDFTSGFLPGPEVKLPPGTWDITAIAQFYEGPDCSPGPSHTISATVRVMVTD